MKVALVIISVVSVAVGILWTFGRPETSITSVPVRVVESTPTRIPTLSPTWTPTSSPTPSPQSVPELVLHDVPFSVQAPRGQWDQDIYQYACEEASILMAIAWIEGKAQITPDEAEQGITDIAFFAQDYIGTYYDASASDTMRLFQAYYPHDGLILVEDATAEDIKSALYRGSIVMLPTNGQILKNPNYTPPGPVEHMLVVVGYDPTTDEFITNDVGISQGKQWRYDASLFEQAMQDYPTGHKEGVSEIRKPLIVISR